MPHGLRTSVQRRELGLYAANGGVMRAEHIRSGHPAGATAPWPCQALDLHFLFVLMGHVSFTTMGGQTVTLRAGDCAHVSGPTRSEGFECASDFEVVEITAPGDASATAEKTPATPGGAAARGRISEFTVNREHPEAYKVGDGPRKFLAYRDAGATQATGRRVNVNVVRNSRAGESSTGWHYHSLACQFLFVLKGWSRVEVDAEGEITLYAGDSMTIPCGLKHDVTGFSEDFTVLELNIPADYDTVACDAPARKGA